MRAFRVVVDGIPLGDLGAADFSVANLIVGLTAGSPEKYPYSDGDIRLNIGGLSRRDGGGTSWDYSWDCPNVGVGSKIEVEIVESEVCVPPTRRFASDRTDPYPSFSEEEIRQMRYRSYLELKKEFGDLPDPKA